MPPPVELLGGGSMDLEHYRSGGTPLSCRRPDSQGMWPFVAAYLDGDA